VRATAIISPYAFAKGQLTPSVQSCTQLVWPGCGQLQQLPGRLNTQKLALPQPALAGQPSAGQASFASFVPSMITTLSHSFALAGSVHCLYFGVTHHGASPFGRFCIVAPLWPRFVTQYFPKDADACSEVLRGQAWEVVRNDRSRNSMIHTWVLSIKHNLQLPRIRCVPTAGVRSKGDAVADARHVYLPSNRTGEAPTLRPCRCWLSSKRRGRPRRWNWPRCNSAHGTAGADETRRL